MSVRSYGKRVPRYGFAEPASTTNYQLITVLFTNISSYDIITIYRLIRRRASVSRALRQQNFHLRDSKLCCSADFLFKTVIARGAKVKVEIAAS